MRFLKNMREPMEPMVSLVTGLVIILFFIMSILYYIHDPRFDSDFGPIDSAEGPIPIGLDDFLGTAEQEPHFPTTGQQRTMAAHLKLLANAIQRVNRDLGGLPGISAADDDLVKTAKVQQLFGRTPETNILFSAAAVPTAEDPPGGRVPGWRGPYLRGSPERIMTDSWGTPIRLFSHRGTLYLHSAGADRAFSPRVTKMRGPNSSFCDDIRLTLPLLPPK